MPDKMHFMLASYTNSSKYCLDDSLKMLLEESRVITERPYELRYPIYGD